MRKQFPEAEGLQQIPGLEKIVQEDIVAVNLFRTECVDGRYGIHLVQVGLVKTDSRNDVMP